MTTLFDLAKHEGDWSELQKHLTEVETQVGSEPGEAACGCGEGPCRKRTMEEHRAGIEEVAWSRCSLAAKSEVLRALFPEDAAVQRLQIALLRLKEGEAHLQAAWRDTKSILFFSDVTTEEGLAEADAWIEDVASAALEAIFPWSVIEPHLRALR